MMPQTVLVTGANRGFGLEFARQYAERGDTVIATARQPEAAHALQALAQQTNRVHILQLDTGDEASIHACYDTARKLTDHIDILINNAGMGYYGDDKRRDALGAMDMGTQTKILQVNAIGPLIMAQTFLELLRKSKQAKVINISSWLSSIGERTPDFSSSFGYSASKTTLNMYSRILAFALLKENILVVPFDPGWAKTEMGGSDAEQEVDETVSAMLSRIDGLTMRDSGHFVLWHGGETEW
jgi:NAD(P)-dependent dehydrogenase (short-subunit alcohol dehydrogenase family)